MTVAPTGCSPGEQGLAEAIVDFVRARVQQVFTFDIDFRAAEVLGKPARVVQRRGAPRVVRQQVVQLGVESGVAPGLVVGVLEFFERRHRALGT